jgi:hypothetical protein
MLDFEEELEEAPEEDPEFDLGDELGDLLDTVVEDYDLGLELSLSGFGHVTYHLDEFDSRDRSLDGSSNDFVLGGLDLFLNARLDTWVYFLNETIFEFLDDGEAILDVERIVLRLEFHEAFNFSAGRMHSNIGYWNIVYHHGEYVQNSIGRPAILNFEDENGLLPTHVIGLRMSGDYYFGDVGLTYALEVGNGRGPTPDPPQIVEDANDVKMVLFTMAVRPMSGLQVGGFLYADRIPENTDPADGPVHGKIDEFVGGTHIRLELAGFAILAEYFFIRHDDRQLRDTAYTHGYYVELSYRVGDVMPYARYDAVDISNDDTFFASTADIDTIAVGVRWDFASGVALKVQPFLSWIDEPPTGENAEVYGLDVQLTFAF